MKTFEEWWKIEGARSLGDSDYQDTEDLKACQENAWDACAEGYEARVKELEALTPEHYPPQAIAWKKNNFDNPYFEDGTVFIGAVLVTDRETGLKHWEIDPVYVYADDDHVRYMKWDTEDGYGDPYTAWDFTDFDYYIVIQGSITEGEQ
jgi:hypothetical protein